MHLHTTNPSPLEQRLSGLDAKWEVRFGEIGQHLSELDAKWEVRFATVEQSLAEQRATFEGRFGALDTRMEAVRADLMKWMIGFWATTILTMIGTGVAVVSLLS